MKVPTHMPILGTRFPVEPRLAPEGETYICDACGREWPVGEVSGCGPCLEAIQRQAR